MYRRKNYVERRLDSIERRLDAIEQYERESQATLVEMTTVLRDMSCRSRSEVGVFAMICWTSQSRNSLHVK